MIALRKAKLLEIRLFLGIKTHIQKAPLAINGGMRDGANHSMNFVEVNSMNQLRIKVAKACGWKFTPMRNVRLPGDDFHWHCEAEYWTSPDGERSEEYDCLPHYDTSLDAIRPELEKLDNERNLLPDDQGHRTERDRFLEELEQIIEPTCAEEDIYFKCITATPEQLCRAFLPAKGVRLEGE